MKTKTMIILGSVVLAVGILLWAKAEALFSDRPHFEKSSLVITRADGKTFPFKVEVANSVEEQTYGLMFIRSLPDDAGMIFPYNPPREIAFWMKNTYIPLDMLFVRTDGTIGRIVAETKPLDVTPIPSQQPVIAVIEINGGEAEKDGLAVGDKVDSPVFASSPN